MAAKSGGGRKRTANPTTSQRKKMPASNFGLPDKEKYPLTNADGSKNIKRARNALARVAQNGSAPEKAVVRARVAKKYPSINVTGIKKSGKGK